jgi:hypothetical protein
MTSGRLHANSRDASNPAKKQRNHGLIFELKRENGITPRSGLGIASATGPIAKKASYPECCQTNQR